jgi:hypothetical protein
LPRGTCGDSPEARTAIAGLAKGTFLCIQEPPGKTPLPARNHPLSCSVVNHNRPPMQALK